MACRGGPPSPSTALTGVTVPSPSGWAFCDLYLLGGGLAGGLRFQYYPMLLSGPVTPLTVSFFAVYGLLCFTPVLLDALSRRRYLVRKGGTPRA